jgi:hypothetical protein
MNSTRSTTLCRAEFLHVVVPRHVDPINDRPPQVRTSLSKQVHPVRQGLLLLDGEPMPPTKELVSDLNLPHWVKYEPKLIMSQASWSVLDVTCLLGEYSGCGSHRRRAMGGKLLRLPRRSLHIRCLVAGSGTVLPDGCSGRPSRAAAWPRHPVLWTGTGRLAGWWSLVRALPASGWWRSSRMVMACRQASRAASGLPELRWVSPRWMRISAS